MITIGKRIKELRVAKQWTQQYVADALGIDRSNYSKYEQDKLSLNPTLIILLAELFGETTDYILLGKEK